jgi:DedD protein
MTRKNGSNADFNPKHRIVGAIIVVSLAVIFVPMILDEREPPARRNSIVDVPEQSKTENGADTRLVVVPIETPRALRRSSD